MNYLKIIRLFSIDIATGSVAGSLLATRILGIELSFTYMLLLFMSTIIVYSSDHLLDGIRKKGDSRSEAHRFFYKYRNPILIVTTFISIFVLRLAFYSLDRKLIEFGLILGGFIIVYFLLNTYYQKVERVFFIKEMWITLLYCFAVIGGPLVIYEKTPPPPVIMLFISYGLFVFSNVLSYSYYEQERDLTDGEKTLATQFGKHNCRILILLSLGLAITFLILCLALFQYYSSALLIMAVMNLLLFCLIIFKRYFSRNDRYGWFADAVFLLPLAVLIM